MKKISKILCTGALAVTSALSLTGCNLFKKDLSDEQIDKLMYILDNADKYMDESLNLLEKSNEQLNADEVNHLLTLTQTNFYLNVNDVRDNIFVEYTADERETGNKQVFKGYLYKDKNGNYYGVYTGGSEASNYTKVIYEDNGKVYVYEKLEQQKVKREVNYFSSEACMMADNFFVSFGFFVDNSKEWKILDVTLTDDRNYEVTVVNEINEQNYVSKTINKFEITRDAKYVKMEITEQNMYVNDNVESDEYDVDYSLVRATIDFKYNGVNEKELMNIINEAKAYNN